MSLRHFGLLAALLILTGCNPITQENFAKLEAGMSRQQVEELLGKPGECAGALGMSSCTWGSKHRFISIQYAGDKVLMFSGQGLK
ncbi:MULTISPECIES: outer membrane protein assembly factor BamE domain-containing protein [Pseudomonadaceae]|jgi:hypothetical protein|uniref:Putative lipoprotein n=1 Tax=Pseudomonas saudiphocaensis TaxID=1499686 RepID=A0A078LZC2_9PSED|nr:MULTISPECIES: outer membrane protein assembly factor BamE [Pseudomonadaceae]MBE7926046.1 outer membrane protein assembly factor BamE [Pseudomonas saudiphocaensis]MCF6783542.1 outer membrane protein assembly factor BamE [Stutzerimonas stutzeri]MCF6806453.1 outer membrane protein assembly factor BamE [Stutzerimonas stutzeri]RRV13596.1 outer membrane protein assembly factor BamE [Pseudomonas saudiphocaensis]CDZ95181.1 putative lipoprotein [Pseudomonas saudiphocaensis]